MRRPGTFGMSNAKSLAGLRVLVVEDEMMVSMLIEDMLSDLGCLVVGPAARIDDAMQLHGAMGFTNELGLAEVADHRPHGLEHGGLPARIGRQPAVRAAWTSVSESPTITDCSRSIPRSAAARVKSSIPGFRQAHPTPGACTQT